jgi:DNA-binding MarR family transcriptional regulator
MAGGTPGATLRTLVHIQQTFREMNEAITPQQIEILFEIASQPGLTQQELANRTGMALSSISRNLMALGEWNRSGKPGLSLVETADDPAERRRQIAFLTPKGRSLVRRILEQLGTEDLDTWKAPTAREFLNNAYSTTQ